ncbi:hypothetical protein J7E80_19680 [Arthrobacter sp. ISL-28]|nr:hypothetical protein [Arthrobacter sp. ISL-28]
MSGGIPACKLGGSLDYLAGTAMTEHLFSVGAGLDSAVVGEREIAGQLRRSLTAAQESGTASGALIRLFQAASRAARDVGSLITLGDAGRSMVSVAPGPGGREVARPRTSRPVGGRHRHGGLRRIYLGAAGRRIPSERFRILLVRARRGLCRGPGRCGADDVRTASRDPEGRRGDRLQRPRSPSGSRGIQAFPAGHGGAPRRR